MIHHSSKDRVLIKKIEIKIWSMREEIEARIAEEANKISSEGGEIDFNKIRQDYLPKIKEENAENVISLNFSETIMDENKMALGKTVLSEISMEKMFFFSNRLFTEGQAIYIKFCIPKSFIINAEVQYCRPFNLKSRIIAQNKYQFRTMIKFTFAREGERAILRNFLQSIEPEKITATNTETAKDQSDPLADLGI